MVTVLQTFFGFWKYGNFRIFVTFSFYVKSILENLEVLEILFAILEVLKIVDLVKFSLSKVNWFHENQNSELPNVLKCADFALLESLQLISRKIWMRKKSWHFYTVLDQDEKFINQEKEWHFWPFFGDQIVCEVVNTGDEHLTSSLLYM